MRRSFIILLCLFTIATAFVAMGRRTSQQVRRERQQNEQQIARTESQISQNDAEIARQLNRYNSLKANMELRADTIADLNARIDSTNQAINHLSDSIDYLEKYIENLREKYGAALRDIRRRRQSMSDIAFIFSAESFGQAWRRMRFLNQIAQSTTKRAKQVKQSVDQLAYIRSALDNLKLSLQNSVRQLQRTQASLNAQRTEASNMVASLRRQGKNLNRELQRRRDRAEALERELNIIIEQEIAEARERQRREEEERRRREEERRRQEAQNRQSTDTTTHTPDPSTTVAPSSTENTFISEAAADRKLTGSFKANKGKLLFPVAGRYTITSHFGTNEHPELSKVKFDNLGIDIEVPAGAKARAVYEGVVSSIFRLDGFHNVIILRHGEYLTVYAGIDQLAVKKGDKIKTGQTLGSIFVDSNDDNRTLLHFEIRLERQKLNPEEWVK